MRKARGMGWRTWWIATLIGWGTRLVGDGPARQSERLHLLEVPSRGSDYLAALTAGQLQLLSERSTHRPSAVVRARPEAESAVGLQALGLCRLWCDLDAGCVLVMELTAEGLEALASLHALEGVAAADRKHPPA